MKDERTAAEIRQHLDELENAAFWRARRDFDDELKAIRLRLSKKTQASHDTR